MSIHFQDFQIRTLKPPICTEYHSVSSISIPYWRLIHIRGSIIGAILWKCPGQPLLLHFYASNFQQYHFSLTKKVVIPKNICTNSFIPFLCDNFLKKGKCETFLLKNVKIMHFWGKNCINIFPYQRFLYSILEVIYLVTFSVTAANVLHIRGLFGFRVFRIEGFICGRFYCLFSVSLENGCSFNNIKDAFEKNHLKCFNSFNCWDKQL